MTATSNGTLDPAHDNRRRIRTGTIPIDLMNYGEAQRLHIWEVARAATAAPSYFKPLRVIIGSEGESLFQDGGFGRLNNPSLEGKSEIRNLHGANRLGIAVSVGTAKTEEEGAQSSIIGILRSLAAVATNVEAAHQDMENASHEENFGYYRFNAEGDHALQTPMDEWKPKWIKARLSSTTSGHRTLKDITNAYANWLRETPDIIDLFQECARVLVRKRRLRASQERLSQWEAYALGTYFKCNIHGCPLQRELRRETFESHLQQSHGVRPNELRAVVSGRRKGWVYRAPPLPHQ